MLKSEKQELARELNALNVSLDAQTKVAVNELQEHPYVIDGGSMYSVKNTDGTYVLVPLLIAKAQTLNALVHLNKE